MTGDELGELDELRRRAYGPDADIAGDPQAIARLAVLEALARAEEPRTVFRSSPVALPPLPPEHRPRAREPEAEIDPVEVAEPPAAARPGRRRRTGPVVSIAVLAIVAVAVSIALWPRPAPPAAAGSTAEPEMPVDVSCGTGWGARAAGVPTPPANGEAVWSRRWDGSSGGESATVLTTVQGDWVGRLTPVFVPGVVASVVQVVSPATARIITFGATTAVGDAFTTSDYTEVAAMVASSRRLVRLPACSAPDTYPLLIIAPERTCVHLLVTIAAGPRYPATVSIGDGACTRK